MKSFFQFAALIAIATLPALSPAADLAVLRNGYEIRYEQRETLGDLTRLYLNADRSGGYIDVPTGQIEKYEHDESVCETTAASTASPAQKPVDLHAAIDAASKAHALDADFIASVIHAESSFNPKAVSPKGAQGLMQLMPGTASRLGVKDSFDPGANVDGGTRYLRQLLLRYNNDVAKALAAYNAGPHRVDQYHGVPPYRETRQYVAKIIREFNQKKLAAKAVPPTAAGHVTKKSAAKAPKTSTSGASAGK